MEGDNPPNTIKVLTPPEKPAQQPQQTKPIKPTITKPKPTPTITKPIQKKTLAKPTPSRKANPQPPAKRTPSIQKMPAPTTTTKPIPKIWWLWLIIGIAAIIIAIGTLILIGNNPFDSENSSTTNATPPTNPNQSQTIAESKIFTCEEVIQLNKNIIDESCDENALFEVVGGIDYITIMHSNSTEDSCINGPKEIIDYINNTCGEESIEILRSLKVISPTLIE